MWSVKSLLILITWVFDPEGFTPMAKLTPFNNYSIVSDHLGTPILMYDKEGKEVWHRELTIYGEVKELRGWRVACPFMYPGQYEDLEIGIHYNFFRYYDPDMGQYISQDRIGLHGGLKLHSYPMDPNSFIDPFGLVLWAKGGFNQWFNNASVKDILAHKEDVKDALRAGVGKHELFPVSQAAKARELGFSAEEIKKMSIETKRITFVNVTNAEGIPVPDGPHTGSSAGRHFHNKLIADLQDATSKTEAKKIIAKHHKKHMKLSSQSCKPIEKK